MATEFINESTYETMTTNRTSSPIANELLQSNGECKSSFELVMITLTLPLWTFITLYLLLLLIYYLRQKQYFTLYDKCTPRNAHFRYDFHLVTGKHSSNYTRQEAYFILDLLDNSQIPTLSIQIPGSTLFNEQQISVYKHSRPDLRCVQFTIYRKHPIKDVRCIRIAHTCTSPDSRIYVYGVDLHDQSNGESRFFPIQSVVKNRGTQWALMTTFEPKADSNFKKLGVDCYDPFGYSFWPTYLEVLTIILYIWCATFCFGYLIGVKEIADSIPLHALTVFFITATSAAVICFVYLNFIKSHIIDIHYETYCWMIAQCGYIIVVIIISLAFWSLAMNQSKRCRGESLDWLISTVSCSLVLTLITFITWVVFSCKRSITDKSILAEIDTNMAKTNSRENMVFVADPVPGFCAKMFTIQPKIENSIRLDTTTPAATGAAVTAVPRANKTNEQQQQRNPGANSGEKKKQRPNKDDETLDTAFGHGSKYMKAKNRNSISQYV